jgi:hypothetical protein
VFAASFSGCGVASGGCGTDKAANDWRQIKDHASEQPQRLQQIKDPAGTCGQDSPAERGIVGERRDDLLTLRLT